jgi:hypothetical protein
LLFVSCLYFGGLRGSRTNTLWTLLHAVLIIHLSIRKFSKTHILLLALLAFGFLYIGKIYKVTRGEFIIENDYSLLEQDVKASDILVGDLSRYGMQAYLIYEYEKNTDYVPKFGSTYVGDILKFIPIYKESSRKIDKVSAGTELMYGKNAIIRSSRIYGLLGESILNFGILLSPIVFFLFAIFVKKIKQFNENISINDIRFFLIPLFINLTVMIFNTDLDNVTFFFIKRIVPIFFVIFIIKRKFNKKSYSIT